MKQVASFTVMYRGYSATTLEGFFPDKVLGKNLIIDDDVRERLEWVVKEATQESWNEGIEDTLSCRIFQTEEGENNDDFITAIFHLTDVRPEQVAAVIDYFGHEGRFHLDIPQGKDEIHLITTYTVAEKDLLEDGDTAWKPHVIEHEFEHEVDSIHLHAYDRNQWKEGEFPMILVIVRQPSEQKFSTYDDPRIVKLLV